VNFITLKKNNIYLKKNTILKICLIGYKINY